jgi:predicted phage terminase large subunit-like protein
MVFLPPRHGKSQLISKYFAAWFIGMFPDKRVILTSYEADFAAQWGRAARDLITEHGATIFPAPVKVSDASSSANRWDITGRQGGMITAGVGGAITGRGGNLIIIDDPVKNAEEAQSPTYREKTWEWYKSTLYTRCEPGGAIILIMTRWHTDDLAGRILQDMDSGGEFWTIIDLPAIAVGDDLLGRTPDEALWPERYDVDALTQIKRTVGSYWWSSLYQQKPFNQEGGLFRRQWFRIQDGFPIDSKKVRYWDMAATDNAGDYTAGCLLAMRDGICYVINMKRVQQSPFHIEQLIRQTADLDGNGIPVRWEEEGGSSGKMVSDHLIRSVLLGFNAKGIRSTGSKTQRAGPVASMAEAGNIVLVKGPWNEGFLDELEQFPYGAHDDQVDALSGAFAALTSSLTGAKADIRFAGGFNPMRIP